MLRKIDKNIIVTQRAENLAVHELLLPSVHLVAGGVTQAFPCWNQPVFLQEKELSLFS